MKLVICEKPEIGKAFAEALDTPAKELRGQGIIESGDYTITWCFGHLLSLREPADIDAKYEDKSNIDLLPIYFKNWERLPTNKEVIDYRTGKPSRIDHRDRVKMICGLIDKADSVILAGDMDDEGEQLVYEVVEYSKTKKPLYRVSTNDISEVGFKRAIDNIEPYGKKHINSAKTANARAVCDLIVGINYSRLMSHMYGWGITVGRVQSPTLALVVNRYNAIQNHVKEKYYTLFGCVNLKSGNADFEYIPSKELLNDGEDKIKDRDVLEPIGKKYKDTTQKMTVKRRKSEKQPPLPFNSIELQVYMSKKYKWDITKTDNTTQQLREKHKAITYNRSDCQYLGGVHYTEAPQVLNKVMTALGVDYPLDYSIKSKAFNDSKVTAHHGIIPTGQTFSIDKLTDDEKLCYKVISERYMMQFLPPAIKETAKAEIVNNNDKFSYSETKTIDPGYMKYFGNVDEDKEDDNAFLLNDYKDGEYTVNIFDYKITESETKPLQPYTQASLAKDMCSISKYVKDAEVKKLLLSKDKGVEGENGSIGTSATRGAIIFGLLQKGYIENVKGKLQPTSKGLRLYELMPDEFKTPELTAKWWVMQEQIKSGESTKEAFEQSVLDSFVALLNNREAAKKNVSNRQSVANTATVIGTCPICGKRVVEGKNYYLCESYNPQEGTKCFILGKEYGGAKITAKDAEKLLSGKPTRKLKLTSKAGKQFEAALVFDAAEKKITYKFEEAPKPVVSKNKCSCGGDIVKKKGKFGDYYTCTGDHSMVFIGAEISGYKVTEEDVYTILSGKETDYKEMKSKAGKDFKARLYLGENNKVKMEF